MTERNIYLLKEVMSGEPIEVIAERLGLTVELIEKLQKLAKKYRIK